MCTQHSFSNCMHKKVRKCRLEEKAKGFPVVVNSPLNSSHSLFLHGKKYTHTLYNVYSTSNTSTPTTQYIKTLVKIIYAKTM